MSKTGASPPDAGHLFCLTIIWEKFNWTLELCEMQIILSWIRTQINGPISNDNDCWTFFVCVCVCVCVCVFANYEIAHQI